MEQASKQRLIKIWFTDMWHGFDQDNNMFTTSLARRFNIEICNKPDFLIHSVYGKDYLKYDCCRICFTGDNTRPDFKHNDYNIGFDFTDDSRYLRWPIFLSYGIKVDVLTKPKDARTLLAGKTRFCTFVVSNKYAAERIQFFEKLRAYKEVASGGGYLNNVEGPVKDKRSFLGEGKFTIAFENSSYPGYTTEKIYEAFLSNTIPVYWGNPRIAEDFNPGAFINMHDFASVEEVINYIKFLDENDEACLKILEEPAFVENVVPDKFKDDVYYNFFEKIFATPVSKKPFASKMNDRFEYTDFKIRSIGAKIRNIRGNH
jgi:hypothetical protein